jgi:Cu(I)/Ag(I) efflux system membrane fusion protein
MKTERKGRIWFGLVLLAAVVIATAAGILYLGGGQGAGAGDGKTLYTCGMHPQVVQDHPGNCPICGMRLTPIRKDGADAPATGAGATGIVIDPVTRQNMNIQTSIIQRGPLHRTIRTVGTIDYNETALADVTTKYRGWIEKLYVDATGQLVHKGEPMFEVYSPELYTIENEYLLALNGGTTNEAGQAALREAAARKLQFYDISDEQIAELEKTRTAAKTLKVSAPMDGFVAEKLVVQGQMVDAGMQLYRLADLGIVWVFAEIYEQDLPVVAIGQEAVVKLSSLPDREFRGRVTYVYPTVDEKTRTARVRMEFENPGYFLKPGMFVSVEINAPAAAPVLLVPDSAVLRSGAGNTVFIARDGGRFEARNVVLGADAGGGLDEVLSGLGEGDRVVTSGQFMLDSESQLREAIDKMRAPSAESGGTAAPETAAGQGAVSSSAITNSGGAAEPVVYVCPMPEHVSIIYDHPGNCPICGMALVPVTASQIQRLQPGGKVLYYTCPMPEHASVHEDKPGKCPLCGMTLIPVMAPAAQPAPTSPPQVAAPPAAAKQLYTCPMHPEVISDKPGQCPKCGMELVPIPQSAH